LSATSGKELTGHHFGQWDFRIPLLESEIGSLYDVVQALSNAKAIWVVILFGGHHKHVNAVSTLQELVE
jgi:hypothetical protein